MTNNKIDVHLELGKIESRFGKISMKLDECKLSEITKGAVITAKVVSRSCKSIER